MGQAYRKLILTVPLLLLLILMPGRSPAADSGPSPSVGGSLPTAASQENADEALLFCYQGQIGNPRLVVVDKSRQRVMVFRYAGDMILEAEYPCATGENSGNKQESGDERTPVGIYFTTHRYKDNKVTIFGDKALHLNYPNAFDRQSGRKGDGIYIHGTNRPLKPRSSNGCVVMRNEDLHEVEPLIRDNLTPVAVVEKLVWPRLQGRIQSCELADNVDLPALSRINPLYAPEYGLRRGNNGKGNGHSEALARLEKALHDIMRVKTNGLAIFGLRGHWVVVAEQELKKGRAKAIDVVRRFYVRGDKPSELQLLQTNWVLADSRDLTRLSGWAPAVMVAAKKASPPPKAPAKPAVEKPSAQQAGPDDAKQEVMTMLQAWIKDWSGKRHKSYISHYASEFKGDGMNLAAWGKHKAYLNRVYKKITVQAQKIVVEVSGDRAKVGFQQIYRSDWHKDVGYKQLELVKRRGRWLIVSETWHKGGPPQAASPKRASL